MTDIFLDKQDFKIINSDANEYDIYVSSDEEMYRLIRRAVETPFEYIGCYIIDSQGVRGIDYTFGDAIYNDLSEGLTVGLISSIKNHVRNAVSKITADIDIDEIIISVPDFETIEVQIYINGLERPIITELNI